MEIKRMSLSEFREKGLLQEVNRQFLHPLGLALEMVIDDDGKSLFGGVWDSRDDPEGIIFDLSIPLDKDAENYVQSLRDAHEAERMKRFGWVIQPIKEPVAE